MLRRLTTNLYRPTSNSAPLTNTLFRRWVRGGGPRFPARGGSSEDSQNQEPAEDLELETKKSEIVSKKQLQYNRNQELLRRIEARNPTKFSAKGYDDYDNSNDYLDRPQMKAKGPKFKSDFNPNRSKFNDKSRDYDSMERNRDSDSFGQNYRNQSQRYKKSSWSRSQAQDFEQDEGNYEDDDYPQKSQQYRERAPRKTGTGTNTGKKPDSFHSFGKNLNKRPHKSLTWSEAQALEEEQAENNSDVYSREPEQRYRKHEPRATGSDKESATSTDNYNPRAQEQTFEQEEEGGSEKQNHREPEPDSAPRSTHRISKLLDSAATFDDAFQEEDHFIQRQKEIGKQTLPKTKDGSVDPFMSSPYTLETKFPNLYFHGGETAMEEAIRKKINPSTTSVIMFPGQGTQYVGMCGNPNRMSKSTQDLYNNASEILQYDLLGLCLNGPIEKLNKTEFCQPAIVVSSLAALNTLRENNEYAVESCVSTAGFSIGEITALVFGGCLSFEDAIRLVKVRAEAMQLASEIVPSGMATVLFRPDSEINFALKVARSWCEREYHIEYPVCSIANYLFPHCKVIAGHIQAIEFLEKNYKDFKIMKVKRLPVSGAFHTRLMEPAEEALRLALQDIEISPPRIPIFSNESGYRYHTSNEVRKRLPKQVCAPVMWEQVVHNIYSRPKGEEYPSTYECGPGNSLTTVLRQVNARAHDRVKTVGIEPSTEIEKDKEAQV